MNFNKKVVRNAENTTIAGVCGAIAEMFGVEPKIVRILFVLLTILTAVLPGIFLYLFLMLIIPREVMENEADETSIN